MGSNGGRHPQGTTQHHLRTLFLRAPYQEWPMLMHGSKRELRAMRMGAISFDAPTPIVLYAVSQSLGQRRHGLMVLVEHRTERLHDIAGNPESLANEGCASYKEFKDYWKERTHRQYRAAQEVEVFTLAPWGEVPPVTLGMGILRRLYGDYIP